MYKQYLSIPSKQCTLVIYPSVCHSISYCPLYTHPFLFDFSFYLNLCPAFHNELGTKHLHYLKYPTKKNFSGESCVLYMLGAAHVHFFSLQGGECLLNGFDIIAVFINIGRKILRADNLGQCSNLLLVRTLSQALNMLSLWCLSLFVQLLLSSR